MVRKTLTGNSFASGSNTISERYALLGQVNVTSGSFAVNIDDYGGPTYAGTDVRSWYDGVSYQAVASPEPSAMVLLVTALFGLLAYAWRKRR